MILYNGGDENREKGEANASSAWLANPLYMLGMLHFIVNVTPRPGKGRHVATAACPRVEPGYSGSNQEPARLKLIFQG